MSESSGFANIARALGDRIYGPYALGNFLALNGIWVQRLGVAWLTWELTGSPAWLGAVAFANLAPLAIVAPLGGAASDRWGPLAIVRATNVLIALQSLAMLALMVTGQISVLWIMVLTTLLGILMALNQPARLAIIPSLVERRHLTASIAIGPLSYNGAQFIGPALFAFLIPILGVEATLVVQAATAAIFSVILIWTRLRVPPAPRKRTGGLLGDLRDGIAYSWNHVGLLPVLILLTVTAFGTRPISDLFAAFSDNVFSRGADGLGLLTAAIGVGAMIGVIWMARRTTTKGMVNVCLVFGPITCIGSGIFIATDIFWVGMVGAFVLGLGVMPIAVSTQTLMQSGIDPAMRGRVMALYVALWRAVPAIGAAVMGYAAEFVGLGVPPIIGIALVLIVTLWISTRRREIAAAIEVEPEDAKPAAPR